MYRLQNRGVKAKVSTPVATRESESGCEPSPCDATRRAIRRPFFSFQLPTQVRIRPLNKIELDLQNEEIWAVDGTSVIDLTKSEKFSFDHCFGPQTCNQDIYDGMGCNIPEAVFAGKNGTLFAYGQTSAGKTHTLMGSAAEPGLMILAMADLFHMCDERKTHEFLARMSYVRPFARRLLPLAALFLARWCGASQAAWRRRPM